MNEKSMSAKHTPGPWTVYDPEMPDTEATYGIDGPSGQPVVYFGLTQNDGINRLEDAILIAAAPVLLDQLRFAVALLKPIFGNTPQVESMESAIAKAIG